MLFEVPGWNLGEPNTPSNVQSLGAKQPAKTKRVQFSNVDTISVYPSSSEDPIPAIPKATKKRPLVTDPLQSAKLSTEASNNCTQAKRAKQPRGVDGLASSLSECTSSMNKAAAGGQKNRLQDTLAGARFRFLNQKLYQSTSAEALKYFEENNAEFLHYHAGFAAQVSKWPVNPVQLVIGRLEKLASQTLMIVDMGCGDAKIASHFANSPSSLLIHSFDLVAMNKYVQVASMTNVPMPDNSVDIVIFCLSLMNTDSERALYEAWRILRVGGKVWIAEVESRFDPNTGGIKGFCSTMEAWGFQPTSPPDTSNRVFVLLEFRKRAKQSQSAACFATRKPLLKPCLYKKR